MRKRTRFFPVKSARSEKGQVLLLVLILLAVCSLLVKPLLDYMGTGLKTSRVYENKISDLYAADAGIEDATWQIKYDQLPTLFTNPPYKTYDYLTDWSYTLSEQVNGRSVNATIKNVWVPDMAIPSEAQARTIITDEKLIVTGTALGVSTFQTKITYYAEAGENLTVQTLGVWLPPGFTYTNGSSNLEVQGHPYYSVPVKTPHAGGWYIIWSFTSVPFISFPGVDPQDSPMTSDITFSFASSQPGAIPNVISWITTGGVGDIPFSWDADIKVYNIISTAGSTTAEAYTAKSELRRLGSGVAGDYYVTGNSALSYDGDGDRCRGVWHDPSIATVNTSDIPSNADITAAYLYWSGWKNDNAMITAFSDNCVNFNNWNPVGSLWTISSNRFRGQGSTGDAAERTLTMNNSVDLSSYTYGAVTLSWTQTKSGTLESSDYLYFALYDGTSWTGNITAFQGPNSPPNSFSYTIPTQYLASGFKMRFYLAFDSTSEYVYIDNIRITIMQADGSVVFRIDDGSGYKQVYLDGSGQPQEGAQELTASRTQVFRNSVSGDSHGFSYSSYRDVTALVRRYSTPHANPPPAIDNYPGAANYSVGGIGADTLWTDGEQDEIAYAGWSLVLIYTSPDTLGHQLYLYDRFANSGQDVNVDFDGDGQPGGTISGFIVPEPIAGEVNSAKITVCSGEGDAWYTGDYLALNGTRLWDGVNTTGNSKTSPNNPFNSLSLGLGTYDGIDFDTFGIDPPNNQYVTWSSNILRPGDTSAQIDLHTDTDVWNIIYIIISFRSETMTGGSLSYLIRG